MFGRQHACAGDVPSARRPVEGFAALDAGVGPVFQQEAAKDWSKNDPAIKKILKNELGRKTLGRSLSGRSGSPTSGPLLRRC